MSLLFSTLNNNTATGAVGGVGKAGVGSGNGSAGSAGGSASGGGIFNNGGTLAMTNCTIFANTLSGGAGGPGGNGGTNGFGGDGGNGGTGGAATGGGVDNTGFAITSLSNCSHKSNSASGGAGGAGGTKGGSTRNNGSPGATGGSNGGGVANGTGSVTLKNTIVASNTPGGGGYGAMTDSGNNISYDASIAFSNPTSFTNTNPYLGALGNNGGPTRTLPIVDSSSVAIDAADDSAALRIDQRHYYRSGRSDIGAYELNGSPTQIYVTAGGPVASEDGDVGSFNVSRAGDVSAALTVSLSVGGTATNGVDYTTISNTVTIPAGRNSEQVFVRPVSDGIPEGGDTVVLTVLGATNYAVATPGKATVTIYDQSVIDRTKRYYRGSGTDPTFHSFIVPVEFERGVTLTNSGGNAATLFPGINWTNTYYHYNATNPPSATNTALRIPFQNPIVAFGSRVGGSPLYFNQSYTFGAYAGFPYPLNDTALRVSVYNQANFSFVGSFYIPVPDWDLNTNTWNGFLTTNGYTTTVTAYGLTTVVSFNNAFGTWGTAFYGPLRITHTAVTSQTNYVYAVDLYGSTDRGYVAQQSGGSYTWSKLYTLEFENHPAWRAVFINQPQFESTPLPPAYLGKSLAELATNGPPVTNAVSLPQSPSYYTNLDNSPELRQHPILDQFVTDMSKDPIALANYVFNEIDLTDAIDYNDNGSIAEASVNLGGVSRGALDVFQEGQGSPTEQCALLIYLLRQAGVPAVYIYPPRNGLKMLDSRLSKLLQMQVHGVLGGVGQVYTTNTMIAANYPWVAAYINNSWVHLYPWLKDTEIVEGLGLYNLMPANYNNGYKWVKDYIYGKTNIMALSTDDDTPGVLFPKFIQQVLSTNAPGISLDDIGVQIVNRRNYYARWQDFPYPTWVTNTSTAVPTLTDPSITNVFSGLTNIFDTVSIEVYSVTNSATKRIATGDLRLADVHNRKFLLRHDKTGANLHNMTLSLAPYRTNIVTQSSFTNDVALTNKQVITVGLDSTDDQLRIKFTYKRHRALPPNLTAGLSPWDAFWGFAASQTLTEERPLRKGELAAICLNTGRVTRKMLNVHAQELWNMERQIQLNPGATNTVSPDVYQGTTAYLMGMAYYERTGRFQDFNARVHKLHPISLYAHGLAKLSPKRVGGLLPNQGDIILIQPNVDMSFFGVADASNGSLHPDSGDDPLMLHSSFEALLLAENSALEHQILNSYFRQADSISTVKLLQLAQSRSATNGQAGILALTSKNYVGYGNTTNNGTLLKNHDPALWASIAGYFATPLLSEMAVVFVTPGTLTNQANTYKGMGALLWSPVSHVAGLISANMNGGVANNVPDTSFVANNSQNVSLGLDSQNNYYVNLSAPTTSSKIVAPDLFALFNTTEVANNAVAGDYVLTLSQNAVVAQSADRFGLSLQPSPDQNYANVVQFSGVAGDMGSPDMPDKFQDQVADPVSAVSGEFYVDAVDLSLPGPMPLEIRRNYSSLNLADNQFGFGWKLNCMPYLSLNTNGTVIYAAELNGAVIAYQQTASNANVWLPTPALNPLLDNNRLAGIGSTANLLRSRIDKSVNGTNTFYKLSSPDGSMRTFQLLSFDNGVVNATRPYLTTWQDNRGNSYTCQYGTDSAQPDYGQARRIQSSNGNYLGFYFDVYGHIIEAYTGDGRRIQYEYDSFGDLVNVTLPDESPIGYEYQHLSQSITNGSNVTTAPYSTHVIVKELKPDGRLLVNQYDSQRRVTNQLATVGQDLNPIRNATFAYSNNFNLTNSFTNTISGYTLIMDVNGNTNRYDYTNGLITKITDPLNQTLTQDWFDPSETNKTGYYPRSLEFTIDKRGLTDWSLGLTTR